MYLNPEKGKRWLGLLSWTATWVLLWVCDGVLNLGNLALLMVLGSALAGMWLSTPVSLLACLCSVLAFNWFFVSPRFTFNVDLNQDLLLLFTILCVSAMVSHLMSRLRSAAQRESEHAASAERIRALGEQLRDTPDARQRASLLQNALQQQLPAQITVLLLAQPQTEITSAPVSSDPSDKQLKEGLYSCIDSFKPLGPGTGRFENQPHLFLPIRGHTKAMGAAAIQAPQLWHLNREIRHNLQQMCDVLGLEIERDLTLKQAQSAKEEVQNQRIRNTLLTSISHDYRTPLANLIGAASVIHSQNAKLSSAQVTDLASTVLMEAQHLNRMTSNTLQLARLDAAPWRIHKDWESMQEMVGSVLAKTRLRYPSRELQVKVPQNLPLVFCDAMLMVQLLDNLIENAIKYSEQHTRIDIQATLEDEHVQLRVIDRGRGIPDAWKDKVFQVFERINEDNLQADASSHSQLRRGVGVGLAVCKAIANVHNARIWIEDTRPQGATLCLAFPVQSQPLLDMHTAEDN